MPAGPICLADESQTTIAWLQALAASFGASPTSDAAIWATFRWCTIVSFAGSWARWSWRVCLWLCLGFDFGHRLGSSFAFGFHPGLWLGSCFLLGLGSSFGLGLALQQSSVSFIFILVQSSVGWWAGLHTRVAFA